MSYSLVHVKRQEARGRNLGENVYLDDLPNNSDVFVFYYPSTSAPYTELESKLRDYGRQTGGDVFINMGKVGDNKYREIVHDFDIGDLPVIVITGKDTKAKTGQK